MKTIVWCGRWSIRRSLVAAGTSSPATSSTMMDEEKGVEKPSEVVHSPKSDDELAPLIQLFWILVWMAK
jgi:hypothetical protein